MCSAELFSLIERERAGFEARYPEARIRVRAGSSRDAVRALYAAECDLAVIARELEPEERSAALRGGLELEGYRFARDAILVVVHPNNRVENLALEDLRRIYGGAARRWAEFGGRDEAIVPVVLPPRADATEFFMQQVMQGIPTRARALYASSDSAVAAEVVRRPGAVGYVTLGGSGRGARALRLASLVGLRYRSADLEAVHRGEYPLTRFLNLYARPRGPQLANGFITFITSFEGQKIVQDAGLVPTTVPVRFVRRSPMQSTH